MADPRAKNVCHEMIIWKQVIENELKTAAEWESNWGFLKEQAKKGKRTGQQALHGLGASTSTPALVRAAATETFEVKGELAKASAGRAVVQSSSAMRAGNANEVASALMDDRAKALMSHRMTPKERFDRPITTAHEVGWRTSLEKFGVGHHGIKRDPSLWPEA